MRKYIIPVIALFAIATLSVAGNSYAHGNRWGHTKGVMHGMFQPRLDTRLQALVDQGKLTVDQKKLILDKFKELTDQKQKMKTDWKNMSKEERKAAHEKEKTDLQNWAKANGIDLSLLFGKGKITK